MSYLKESTLSDSRHPSTQPGTPGASATAIYTTSIQLSPREQRHPKPFDIESPAGGDDPPSLRQGQHTPIYNSDYTTPSALSTAVELLTPSPGVGAASESPTGESSGPQPRRGTGGSKFSDLRRRTQEMMRPPRPIGAEPTVAASVRALVLGSKLNVLLVFIPVSEAVMGLTVLPNWELVPCKWALNFALPHSFAQKDTLVFIFSFIAIIPLAKLLGFATEELSLRVGQTLAGLLNATLGNAVELIVAIIALVKCELRVVQASLVGSVLSNLLLVLGMCFFAGGMRFSEQGFGISATQLNSSLLTVSVIAVLLPAAFHFSVPELDDQVEAVDILAVSHGVSTILLVIYVGYLIFQLFSHANLYEDTGDHVFKSVSYHEDKKKQFTRLQRRISRANPFKKEGEAEDGLAGSGEEEGETPSMNLWVTISSLVIVTVLVAVTAEWLVDSIEGVTSSGKISKEFVGMILLPIVGNAAEHLTAVTVSVKDKLTLSLGVAVGSSIQIALFVIPLVVTLGWILGKPLTLLFDPYESIALFLSVLTVNYVVQDGKSNWLEGFILMCLYVILAVTFWYYPGSDPSGVLAQCH